MITYINIFDISVFELNRKVVLNKIEIECEIGRMNGPIGYHFSCTIPGEPLKLIIDGVDKLDEYKRLADAPRSGNTAKINQPNQFIFGKFLSDNYFSNLNYYISTLFGRVCEINGVDISTLLK